MQRGKSGFGITGPGWLPSGLGRLVRLAVVVVLVLLLSGCFPKDVGRTLSIASPDFFGLGEELAVQLTIGLRQPLGDNGRIIMATMVNIDDLYSTSRFGRTLTEATATRLFKHGFGVIEVRKATELLIKSKTGELMLSRNAELLAGQYAAVALVTGTYALTPDTVIVNARLIDAGSQDVLSVAGVEIQRSRAINAMLASPDAGGRQFELTAYER